MQSLQTKVDLKYFQGESVTIIKCIKRGDRYVYQVDHNGDPYIIKGYKIFIPHLKPGYDTTKTTFMKSLCEIQAVYQEFFFTKMASTISPHFVKPLEMDYDLQLAKNDRSYTNLFIEILFEYGGESLADLKDLSINVIYDQMRQSANAISILHNTKVIHLDLKPANMVYSNNVVKVIDMGAIYESKAKSSPYNITARLTGKIRELTEIYSPPEVIKHEVGLNKPNEKFEMGKVDVYSWASCFFKILLIIIQNIPAVCGDVFLLPLNKGIRKAVVVLVQNSDLH